MSIAQEIRKPASERHYQDDSIGIVTPLYEFDLPRPVEEFILSSSFDTGYFFVVSTYGMHHGGIAERVSARLATAGRRVDYYNTVIMLDNALNVFDMEEQRKLDPEKHVDEQLAAVRADIEAHRPYIQPAAQEEKDFYQGYMQHPFDLHPSEEDPLYRVTDNCVGCGTCTRVCPMGSIRIVEGRPVYDYSSCANCYACIHACPQKAIRYVRYDEPNPSARYRNPHVTLADLVRANCQL